MQVRIFLTADSSDKGRAPVLYLEDRPGVVVPEHPGGGTWKYFATVAIGDPSLAFEVEALKAAFLIGTHHVGGRLPF
jgi:hypothetical protein